jgi:hypothetical protein
MDAREARRAAEKTARDLITTRTTLIGDLGMAVHHRETATQGVTDARAEGAKLLDAARKQAAELITAANGAITAAEQSYADAYTAALDGGWQKTELKTMHYPPPAARRTTAAPTTDAQRDEPTDNNILTSA